MESLPRALSTPEEELAYLRSQVEAKERELAALKQERPRESVVRDRIIHHARVEPEAVLAPAYQLSETEVRTLALNLDPEGDDETMNDLRKLAEEKGIRNALSVLEKMDSPHLEDDFHRFLVQYLAAGMPVPGWSEKEPAWRALHMTLYEIALPEPGKEQEGRAKALKELISAMEQFYAGMLSVETAYAGEPSYYSLELAVPAEEAHLRFYASVPNGKRDLFENQLLAVFPEARLVAQPNDYNIFPTDGAALSSTATFAAYPALPLKDYADFDHDPLNGVLNAFAKIAEKGEGASVQLLVKPAGDGYVRHYRKILDALRRGEPYDRAMRTPADALGEVGRELGDLLFGRSPAKRETREGENRAVEANKHAIEQVDKKVQAPIVSTNIRILASARSEARAAQVAGELESAFNQFANTLGNRFKWERSSGRRGRAALRDFSYRVFSDRSAMPLSLRELTGVFHFPPEGVEATPHLAQARSAQAPAPLSLPASGFALGVNSYRGKDTTIYMEPTDRLRHLYAVGQTGTGKTGFLRTLIEQDIRNGEGVCFIDPHGNDVLDVLATIPPERYEDVIYFDPAYTARPFGLNLLEYDPAYPEQKTFIVNELLAIFRRLYGDVPESMGPAFEQYFRNATLLVMEDPASGSTLMDIGRVLSNEQFRNYKLSRSMNPVVNQFWKEIAGRAGGDASLENIVPYITNKFDDFTANDFMRPIIGQQESSFRFRDVIDGRKILLVNLSKGRLGERNANLLGLILVGKLFMAALSRADNPRGDFPPFYLYIDEFQNITTDSIPGILSEARKYKLSLTVAHQFLAQVDEKVRDAVFGNVGSMAVFRVGEEDGEFFAKQFAPAFGAGDFANLENRNALVRMLSRGVPQKPFSMRTLDLPPGTPDQVDDLKQLSYLTYGRDRATIEEYIRARYLT
jgi:hypothetical protein